MIDSSATTGLYEDLRSQVHVWLCRPQEIQDETILAGYRTVLSAAELTRCHGFHYESDRQSYLVSHALLRNVLSKYADVPAAQWQFSSNEHGKPELISTPGVPTIQFNLTHTDGLSACIIALNRRCGIDVEKISRKNRLQDIAQRMFADEELARLDDKNIGQQFYHYWTLREAYVKALGTGLAGSSKEYFFNINNNLSVEMHRRDKPNAIDNDWCFKLFEPTPEHVMAVGFESREKTQIIINEFIS